MKKMKLIQILAMIMAMLVHGSVSAAVVNTLPYPGTPDWTDVVFPGTSMVLDASRTTLTTASSKGVWFGWGDPVNYASYQTPNWNLGTNAEGNYLSLTASLGTNATDWSAYILDGSYQAAFTFAPCGSYSCNGLQDGVNLLLPDPNNPNGFVSEFITLDTNKSHIYEFLLKNGQVSYRIDGTLFYNGAARAYQPPNNLRVLVIGDGSGSDPTGIGSMTVHAVRLETGVAANSLSTVPSPSTLWLFGTGVAGLAIRLARHRSNEL